MRIARSRPRPARLAPRLLGALIAGAVALGASLVTTPASAGEILSVKNESANFREGPGEKHPIVFAADRFYPVEVLQKKDGWAKIKDFEGDEAWVAARLLAKQETVVVEGDRVNVREKSTTSAEIAFKAERGEVFKVQEREGRWLKVVDANGDGGWIRDDMVWGERSAAAATPKGKTKGELEDPAAKPAPKSGASKGKAAPPKDDALAEGEEAEPAAKPAEKPAAEEPAGKAAAEKPAGKAAAEKPAEKAAAEKPAEKAAAEKPAEKAAAEKPAADEAAADEAEGEADQKADDADQADEAGSDDDVG